MTPKRRKMISKALIDLFDARAQEYQALINEQEETIDQYDTGDDLVQRELHKEIGETMVSAMNEIILTGNYYLHPSSYYNKLLTFSDINIGNRIWNELTITKRDNPYLWSILPTFKVNNKIRALDIIDQAAVAEMYTNSSFNSVDKGAGLDEPIVSTMVIGDACAIDTDETQNDRNFIRLYEAFTDMKNSFINTGAFVDHGINFNSNNWPPHDIYGDNGFIPTITPSTYDKIPIIYNWTNTNVYSSPYPAGAYIGNLIPENIYVACSSLDDSIISIIKLFNITEESGTIPGGQGQVDTYTYSIDGTRIITTSHSTLLYVNKIISAANAYKVFDEIRTVYLSHLNTFKTMLSNNTENYTVENSLNIAVDNFLSYINSHSDMTTVSNVEDFYTQASAFNTLVNTRISTLASVINSEDNIDDIKELMSIRVGKSNGTLFDIFRRIEGMDSQYIRYIKGNSRITFLKKKMVVGKVIEQPNNSYQITIERNVDSNYTNGENFLIGDTIYLIDNIRPEIMLRIIDIKYGTIDDVDSTNINSSDMTTAVKKVDVRFITVDRIVSNDFDKTETLRIVKLL